ncbi:MAG: hypothetical protein RLZZ476_113 [Verrucomicrobiota bacterium]|jgi:hypothetical protein
MSLETIMEEARKLTDAESRRLSAFLLSLRREPGFAEEMTRMIDDKDPKNWATLEQLDKRFGIAS